MDNQSGMPIQQYDNGFVGPVYRNETVRNDIDGITKGALASLGMIGGSLAPLMLGVPGIAAPLLGGSIGGLSGYALGSLPAIYENQLNAYMNSPSAWKQYMFGNYLTQPGVY